MKIEIPDKFIENRHIRIFAGIEEIARKLKGGVIEIKTVRCSLCGKCCKNCSYLEERQGYKQPNGKWAMMCKLNEARPHNCSNSDGYEEDCSIVWQKLDTINIE